MTITPHNETAVVVALNNNVLGGAEAVEFSSTVHSLCDKGVRLVVIDLAAVQIMNSSGLGMLVGALTTVRKFGGTIRFANVPDKVQTLLTMTHLDSVFAVYSSTTEALAASE